MHRHLAVFIADLGERPEHTRARILILSIWASFHRMHGTAFAVAYNKSCAERFPKRKSRCTANANNNNNPAKNNERTKRFIFTILFKTNLILLQLKTSI
jgi:hypothetical protein